jgi:PTH1 family peptidyl-tRNA hydrolase
MLHKKKSKDESKKLKIIQKYFFQFQILALISFSTFNLLLLTLIVLFCTDMTWVIVGLGNPGEEYDGTRHNTGRMAVEQFATDSDIEGWKENNAAKATIAKGAVDKNTVTLVLPDTYMNKSGAAVLKFVKSVKAAEKMVVVYDDLDLAIGTMKVSFDRGSGGHKGIESIIRAVKTKKFTRVRIGISPSTAVGKLKKPQGEEEVGKFILGTFKPAEQVMLKAVFKKASEAVATIIAEGPGIAMNRFN